MAKQLVPCPNGGKCGSPNHYPESLAYHECMVALLKEASTPADPSRARTARERIMPPGGYISNMGHALRDSFGPVIDGTLDNARLIDMYFRGKKMPPNVSLARNSLGYLYLVSSRTLLFGAKATGLTLKKSFSIGQSLGDAFNGAVKDYNQKRRENGEEGEAKAEFSFKDRVANFFFEVPVDEDSVIDPEEFEARVFDEDKVAKVDSVLADIIHSEKMEELVNKEAEDRGYTEEEREELMRLFEEMKKESLRVTEEQRKENTPT